MNRSVSLIILSCFLLVNCTQSIDASTSFNVAGIYDLVEYQTSTLVDDNPSGALSAVQLDNQHINLLVKGTSGKVKLSYSYTNVTVVEVERDTYELQYKGKKIGVAGNDGISRYMNLYPSSIVSLKGVEF